MQPQKGFTFAINLVLLLSLFSIGIITVAYYFMNKAQDNDFEENIVILNNLQQLDAKWNESILRTNSYNLQDFDQLTRYMIKIRQALEVLEQKGMADKKMVGADTVNQYKIYKQSFQEKNEAIERYKSEQAILRNAVRYLPEVSELVQQTLVTTESTSKKTMALFMLSNLLINQYLLNITKAKVLKEKLAELTTQSLLLSDQKRNEIQQYFIHSNLIVKYKPKVEKMLRTALSVDMANLSTQLVNYYVKSQDTIKERIKYWQNIILFAVALLFILLLWFLMSLRKSASKILQANMQKKVVQRELSDAQEKIKQVKRNMRKVTQQSASGQLSLATFKRLNTSMSVLASHLSFLKNIRKHKALQQYGDKMDLVIGDIVNFYHNIEELNTLINSKENKGKQISFNFNHVIQSAFDTVASEADPSIVFNKQFSSIPAIKASSIDLYQIAITLLYQAVATWTQGDEGIFVKTWATGHYANLCLSLSGYDNLDSLYAEETLADLKELLEQNDAILKLTPRENGQSAIVWVSFPYS